MPLFYEMFSLLILTCLSQVQGKQFIHFTNYQIMKHGLILADTDDHSQSGCELSFVGLDCPTSIAFLVLLIIFPALFLLLLWINRC